MLRYIAAFVSISALGPWALAQSGGVINLHRVSPTMNYHRVWAVTPLVGTGPTANDPVRPMFIPAPSSAANGVVQAAAVPLHSGLLGYQMQLSDDGQFALVEYVFQNPEAFRAAMQQEVAARAIAVNPTATRPPAAAALAGATPEQIALEAAVPGLKIFERGKATDNDILTEFKKHKANFAFGTSTVRPQ